MAGGTVTTIFNLTAAPLSVTGPTTTYVDNISERKVFQAVATTTAGAGSATVNIEATLDGTHFDVIATLTCTASTAGGSDSIVLSDKYRRYRANVTAIGGTGCSVQVYMGC